MEAKGEPSIDRIKILENHINELKSILSNFFEKKGRQFRDIKIFRKTKDNKGTETIDDLDIHTAPVMIDVLSIQEIRDKMNNLEYKLNSILDVLNSRTVQPDSIDELRDMIKIIKDEIYRIKEESGENREKIEGIEKTITQMESGVLCFE